MKKLKCRISLVLSLVMILSLLPAQTATAAQASEESTKSAAIAEDNNSVLQAL